MEVIIAAVITGILGIVGTVTAAVVVQVKKLRRENTDQHAEGRAILNRLADRQAVIADDVSEIKGDVKGLDRRVGTLEASDQVGRSFL